LPSVSASLLTTIQAYLHVHSGGSIPLRRGKTTLQITTIRDDMVGIATGRGLIELSDEDLAQMCRWIAEKTGAQPALSADQVLHKLPTRLQLMPLQAYLHTHIGMRIPLRRGKKTLSISFIRDDSTACAENEQPKHISLSEQEVEQMLQWVAGKTGTSTMLHDTERAQEVLALHQRLQVLEAERKEWLAWKEAEIVGSGALTAMRQYLQDHEQATIPIKRGGMTVRIWGIGEDAVAFSEKHGLIRLNDEELEQGRIWVCQKIGVPVIASRLPIGESSSAGQRRLQLERELETAQSEIRALHRELARYLPAPRELLEHTLRRWCALTHVFIQDKELAGEELDTFIQESNNQQLLKFIKLGEDCYFIGKRCRQRIALIQQHLQEVPLYQGNPALTLKDIDDQGYAIFANGDRTFLDTDAVNQFWARIVGERGQQHVGGNTTVAPLQQYLWKHPGASIPLQRFLFGALEAHQLVLVADDALAITTQQRLIRLYDDDIEQARRWLKQQT
jgi:hypothetical protein